MSEWDVLGRARPVSAAAVADALASGHPGALAAAALANAPRAESAVVEAAVTLVATVGADGALVAVAACARSLAEHPGARAAVPLARAFDVVAERVRGRATKAPSAPSSRHGDRVQLERAVDAALAAADPVAAVDAVRCAEDLEQPELESALVAALYGRAGTHGHLAPVALATVELSRLATRAQARALYAAFAAALAAGALPADAEQVARVAPLLDSAAVIHQAEDDAKSSAFQEARFRPHLLGAKADVQVRAIGKALAFGVPRALVASSLTLAAAERLLRFDPANHRSARQPESWLDLGWLLQVCEATRALGRLHDRPEWLGLLLQSAAWVRDAASLDAETPAPVPEPESMARTWDHGPEIARITGAMLRADADAAMAALRGYLLMVLPEQPLSAGLLASALEDRAATAAEQGQLLATLSAALEGFGAASHSPHRHLLPCAALRLWCQPTDPRPVHAFAHAAVDTAEGAIRARVTSPLPWCAAP